MKSFVKIFLCLVIILSCCTACKPGIADTIKNTAVTSMQYETDSGKNNTGTNITDKQKNMLVEFIGKYYSEDTSDTEFLGRIENYVVCKNESGGDTAEVNVILGGYKIYNSFIGYPSSTCIYIINDEAVYTLQDAYVKEIIDIGKVYNMLHDFMKKGTSIEDDILYNE